MQDVAFFASRLPFLPYSHRGLSCLARFPRGSCGCSPRSSTVSRRPQAWSAVHADPPCVSPPRHVSIRHVALLMQRILIIPLSFFSSAPPLRVHSFFSLLPPLGVHSFFSSLPSLGLNFSLFTSSPLFSYFSSSLLLNLHLLLSCFLHPLFSSPLLRFLLFSRLLHFFLLFSRLTRSPLLLFFSRLPRSLQLLSRFLRSPLFFSRFPFFPSSLVFSPLLLFSASLLLSSSLLFSPLFLLRLDANFRLAASVLAALLSKSSVFPSQHSKLRSQWFRRPETTRVDLGNGSGGVFVAGFATLSISRRAGLEPVQFQLKLL